MKIYLFFLLIIEASFAQSRMDIAEELFLDRKLDESKFLFEQITKENPNNLKALEYLGDIHGIQSQWSRALSYYAKLKRLSPNEANYWYKYGGVLGMIAKESNKFKALGMIADIKESFEKAIKLDPKHIEARWALIELYLQLPGIVGGSESKATRYANELLSLSKVDGYLAKGKIAEYFSRYHEAEKHYLLAAAVGNSKLCYQKLADLYTNKMKQPEKGKQVLLRINEKYRS